MKLSASLYSNKNLAIADSVKELEEYFLDYWHIDSIENLKVFEDIQLLNTISDTPIDLHVISKNPAEYLSHIEAHKIDRVSFQIEELDANFLFPKFSQTKTGMAIQIGHPQLSQTIEKYQSQIDFVLLMMTTPGVSGGKFEKKYFSTIRQLTTQFPTINWCIDGGVNHEISYILRLQGIQSIVIGSYLMQHENMARAILNIRSNYVKSEYLVSDFKIPTESLPLVTMDDTVKTMLQKMDAYKLGTVFFIDKSQRFLGIISNADVRRVLLEGNFDYSMSLDNFVNKSPKTILDTNSTTEMIDFIEQIKFPILVLPIIDKNGTLTGAISFHKLLKEE